MSRRLRGMNSAKISFFAFQDIITSVSGILILVTLILATELDRADDRTLRDGNPELEEKLAELLYRQAEVDAHNVNLRQLLATTEAAPSAEKLSADIQKLKDQLAEEQARCANSAEQVLATKSNIDAQDQVLGLSSLKAQLQREQQEAETTKSKCTAVRVEMNNLGQKVANLESKLLKLKEREGKLWLIPEVNNSTKEPVLVTVGSQVIQIDHFDRPELVKKYDKKTALTEFETYLKKLNPVNQYLVFFIRPSGISLFNELSKTARNNKFEIGYDAMDENVEVHFTMPPALD